MEEKRIKTKDAALVAVLLAALIVLVIFASFFGGREAQAPKPVSRDYFGYFDTLSTVADYSGDKKQTEEVFVIAEEMLEKYHKLFDIYHEYSDVVNVASLNRTAKVGEVKVSRELFDFLVFSKEMHALTRGEVNIAMGAVLSIWHDHREFGITVPSAEELSEAAKHCDINDLVLDTEDLTVFFADPEMTLDVGAIAKGYAAERIAEALSSGGYSSVTLDFGGNVRVVGTKPDGEGWVTGVKNPYVDGGDYIYKATITDSSAVTSGDYERRYEVNGVKYHHIIDKDSLMPSSYFASVTVFAEDSGVADALSTALFNMSYDEGAALLSTIENASAVWAFPDGEIKISQ